jgi:hypothetical protein
MSQLSLVHKMPHKEAISTAAESPISGLSMFKLETPLYSHDAIKKELINLKACDHKGIYKQDLQHRPGAYRCVRLLYDYD